MLFYNKYLPNLSMEDEKEAYARINKDHLESKPFPGIVDVIKKFKEKGIKMVVLSSDFPENLLPEIKNFGLEGVFIDVVMDVHDKLNDARKLINKNNFKKEETIFIGDSNHEIEVGKEIGIKTGAVTWGFCPKEKLEVLKPDFLINNLDDLEAAILEN